MSITDELREYAGSFYLFRYKDVREKLDAIADRIDAEHERLMDEQYKSLTVEDVMVEFATDWESAQDGEDKAAVLKEYAKRLTLAEGEDA